MTDLEKVKRNGLYLQYIENQTEEICEAAVKQNPRALDHVLNQTEEMCRFVVNQNSNYLVMVRYQTLDIVKDALVSNTGHPRLFEFISEKIIPPAKNNTDALNKISLLIKKRDIIQKMKKAFNKR